MTINFLPFFIATQIYMLAWFIYAAIKKRNDVADTAWGLGFVLMSWLAFFVSGNFVFKNILVNLLVTVWGFRLAWHIHQRNKNKSIDTRYLEMQKNWGKWFLARSYLQVFVLQGLLLSLIVMEVVALNLSGSRTFNIFDLLGLLIWNFGFWFESTADRQLANFLKSGQKGITRTGLWKYSRHPNYFGEVTMWWGFFVMTLGTPFYLVSLISPLVITILILWVSNSCIFLD